MGRKDSFCRVLFSQMVRKGLMLVERNGRRRSYRLKEPSEYLLEVSGFFSNLEKIRQREYLPLIRKVMLELFRIFGDDLVSIVLFGSVARGDAKATSDIDLLIVAEGFHDNFVDRIRLLDRVELASKDLSERLWRESGIYATIQFYPLRRDEATVSRPLYLDLLHDALILYDKDGVIAKVLSNLGDRLKKLGSIRVHMADGSWYWILKPDLKFGETISL